MSKPLQMNESEWRRLRSRALERLTRWVRYDSSSLRSNVEVNESIQDDLEGLGFDVEVDPMVDEFGTKKSNLIAWLSPKRTDRDSGEGLPEAPSSGGVAYFCHSDVVPATEWEAPSGSDPFQAAVVDDRIYGRGTCDMKGSLAVFLSALESLAETTLTRPVWVVVTADEERGFGGARHVVKHSTAFAELRRAQPVAIIGEPTGCVPVHATKGVRLVRMRSRGVAAHSGTDEGTNATEAMIEVMSEVVALGKRLREQTRYFNDDFDPPHVSWNFGMVDANHAINVTPPMSEGWIFFRPMPGVDLEHEIVDLRSHCHRLGVQWNEEGGGDPMVVDADAEHIRRLERLTGHRSQTVCYGTDAGEFAMLDRRVVLGPGDIAMAHRPDEYLAIAQIDRGITVYRDVLREFAGP